MPKDRNNVLGTLLEIFLMMFLMKTKKQSSLGSIINTFWKDQF